MLKIRLMKGLDPIRHLFIISRVAAESLQHFAPVFGVFLHIMIKIFVRGTKCLNINGRVRFEPG